MYCINCGKEVIKNSKFCKHCGFKIHESGNNEFVENMYTSINNNELNVKENILLKCKGCNENFNKNDLIATSLFINHFISSEEITFSNFLIKTGILSRKAL